MGARKQLSYEIFKEWMRVERSWTDPTRRGPIRMLEFYERYTSALVDMLDKSLGRSLVTTVRRRLGTVWSTAKKGDKICVLFGCDWPLIVRHENDHWILIGDAYLHGAMRASDVSHHEYQK